MSDFATGTQAPAIGLQEQVESVFQLYRRMESKYREFEDSLEMQRDETIFYELLELMESVKMRVDAEGFVSRNENIDDIATSSLQFLCLPYLFASVCGRCPLMNKRIHYLQLANSYMEQYVELCVKTGVVKEDEVDGILKEQKKVWRYIFLMFQFH